MILDLCDMGFFLLLGIMHYYYRLYVKTKPKVSDDYSSCGSRLEQSTMTFVRHFSKDVATDNCLVAPQNQKPYPNLRSFITANWRLVGWGSVGVTILQR